MEASAMFRRSVKDDEKIKQSKDSQGELIREKDLEKSLYYTKDLILMM